ncbi:uncharacterized protein LOC133366908 [Rhineura floridana]|uniref:uncharacterized protein LOC133366908 n=1 Tax=Rhineura floridana TaxID=261503 RepID=UPI002AC7EDA3|nr:uncharacterized protein LOC133366908 [Rhineura floridana]
MSHSWGPAYRHFAFRRSTNAVAGKTSQDLTRDTSQSQVFLQLSGLTLEDTVFLRQLFCAQLLLDKTAILKRKCVFTGAGDGKVNGEENGNGLPSSRFRIGFSWCPVRHFSSRIWRRPEKAGGIPSTDIYSIWLQYRQLLDELGISSQITLTEPNEGIKRPGETLQLTCTVTGFSLTSYGVNWVHQLPEKGLEWAGGIGYDGSTSYNPALQNRITITRDISKCQVFLQRSGLKPEDTAIYYCARYTSRKCFSETVQKLLLLENQKLVIHGFVCNRWEQGHRSFCFLKHKCMIHCSTPFIFQQNSFCTKSRIAVRIVASRELQDVSI